MWSWLKNLLGLGKSSWEPLDSDHERTYINTGLEQCEHTDVEEVTETHATGYPSWRARQGYLLIPQVTYDIIRCNQCNCDLSWDTSEGDTLAFRPSFTVAPDVSTDEALAAHDAGTAREMAPGKVLINRSENPAEDTSVQAGGPTD